MWYCVTRFFPICTAESYIFSLGFIQVISQSVYSDYNPYIYIYIWSNNLWVMSCQHMKIFTLLWNQQVIPDFQDIIFTTCNFLHSHTFRAMNFPLVDQLRVPVHFRVQPEQVPFTLNDLLPAFQLDLLGEGCEVFPIRVPDEWSYNNIGRRGMKKFRMPMPSTCSSLTAFSFMVDSGALRGPFWWNPASGRTHKVAAFTGHVWRCTCSACSPQRSSRLCPATAKPAALQLETTWAWRPDSQSGWLTHSKRSLTVGTAGPASKFTIFKHPLEAESALYPLVNLDNELENKWKSPFSFYFLAGSNQLFRLGYFQ